MNETGDCDNLFLGCVADEFSPQLLQYTETDEDVWNWNYPNEESSGALDAVFQPVRFPNPGAQNALHDPTQPKPHVPLNPCFRHFQKKDCPGNCGWYHCQVSMQKHRLERLEMVLNSPFTPLELIKSEIVKQEQRSLPRSKKSAILAAETWEEAEAQHAPLSPSLARITTSSQTIPYSPSISSQEFS